METISISKQDLYNFFIENLYQEEDNLKKIYELDKYKENLLLNLWYTIIRFKKERT